MNEIINKFLLAGDKFMPELHLKQPGFTYSACGPFTRNKERIEKFIQTGKMVYKFFGKTSSGSGVDAKPNYQLSNELHRQIIRRFKRRKVYSLFRDNIWGIDLADMQLMSKYNKGIKYLLCAIDLFSKYAWVVPLNDKRGISIINAFQKIVSKGHKPNKIGVDQGGEFYNNLFKRFLKISNIVMYSTYNEGKCVVAEFLSR